MTSLKTAERLLLSCLDRPDAAAALLGPLLSQIASDIRRVKWNLTHMARRGHITGDEARQELEIITAACESVSIEMLLPARDALVGYLTARRPSAEQLDAVNALLSPEERSATQHRDAVELSNTLIAARERHLRRPS